METVYNFINGKQVASKGTKAWPIYNPATGEQIRQVMMSTPEEVNEAVEVAHAAFRDGRRLLRCVVLVCYSNSKNCCKETGTP